MTYERVSSSDAPSSSASRLRLREQGEPLLAPSPSVPTTAPSVFSALHSTAASPEALAIAIASSHGARAASGSPSQHQDVSLAGQDPRALQGRRLGQERRRRAVLVRALRAARPRPSW